MLRQMYICIYIFDIFFHHHNILIHFLLHHLHSLSYSTQQRNQTLAGGVQAGGTQAGGDQAGGAQDADGHGFALNP